MAAKTDEYMPWIVVDQNGLFMVVRDSFCSPYGPRIWHRFETGVPAKFNDVRDAWEVAHRLNAELYQGLDTLKRNRNNWIQTYTGEKFYPTDPDSEEVCIFDIAHALSNTCRFSGHCEIFYSVAQHCVLGSYHCDDALWFLLHDAAEAYLVDLPRPIKKCFPVFEELENKILEAIAEKFNLDYPFPDCVHVTDNRMLQTERKHLLGPAPALWKSEDDFLAYDIEIERWTPAYAERQFLERFGELTGQTRKESKTA